MTPHAFKIESLIISVSHMSLLLKNISHMSMQIFHGQFFFFFNSWKGVKVGNSEIFLTNFLISKHVGRFQISFFVNLLALKFGTHLFNIKMMLCQKFHDHMTIFRLSGGCQSSYE